MPASWHGSPASCFERRCARLLASDVAKRAHALRAGSASSGRHAQIVLLRGGMFNGAKHDGLRAAWTSAVEQLEAADKQVHHYVFTHWSGPHPRVADDRALADELTAWLKTQDFMAAYK